MKVSDQLLDKYFKNKCTPEEKLLVDNYLREIDELPDHLVRKEEWDDAEDQPLSYEKSEAIFEAITQKTLGKKNKHLWLKITAVAATILVVITIGLFLSQKPVSQNPIAENIPQKIEKPNEINWKSIVNYTDRIQDLTLPDQSIVKIYPGAELRYAIPFVKSKREIYLEGKGYFQVTKDKQHPFVVYAKGVSTTALGTSFTIIANPKNKLIKVQLHTGKVWVRDIDSVGKKSSFSRILLPGNSLVFNRIKNELKVEILNTAIVKAETKIELNFTQAPLVEVFSKLEQHYKTKIIYSAEDLSEISFTGTLKLEQPINKILAEITELNKLKQEKIAEGYLIKK
ncbi:FecR family protein [Pedobacter chinensis]|uniref:FecR family protein n=1 Tax=Pedobacter chinensis TaxID=2282421 RepID=A0A369PXD7_9SPHI|nr:FecR family protein [Pedobacter chinensis]RDC56910.1 FecR family protein [Pedobacter chinensis]